MTLAVGHELCGPVAVAGEMVRSAARAHEIEAAGEVAQILFGTQCRSQAAIIRNVPATWPSFANSRR